MILIMQVNNYIGELRIVLVIVFKIAVALDLRFKF